MASKPGFFQRHSNIYLYIPNLIGALTPAGSGAASGHHYAGGGERRRAAPSSSPEAALPRCAGYARVAFTLYAFHLAFKHPAACVALYFFGWAHPRRWSAKAGRNPEPCWRRSRRP